MPKDLTWNQLRQALTLSGAIYLSGTDVLINVSQITGDTYANLDAIGVTEFIQKLLVACNKAQVTVNQGVDVGSRLATYFPPNFATPTKSSDGLYRVSCTQQVVSRLTVNSDSTEGTQN